MQQHAFDFDQAARRRDAGMASAAAHAERETSGWVELAAEAIRRHAMRIFPLGFTTEEARFAIESTIPRPPELRAWGAVTRICKARKYIEPIPWETRAACSSNGSPKQVYRLGSCS